MRIGVILFLATLLTACGREPTVTERLDALDDARWQVRAANAEALGRIGAREAIPALRDLLDDRADEVRSAAVIGLRHLEAEEALEDFRRLAVDDDDRHTRVHALFGIAAVGDAADLDVLLEAQRSSETRRVRRAARRVMWSVISPEALAAQLRAGLRSESAELRRAAAQTARQLDIRVMRGWERDHLDDGDRVVRSHAWLTFIETLRSRDRERLFEGLRDDDARVRRAALAGLEKLKGTDIDERFRAVIVDDDRRDIRRDAARRLAERNDVYGSVVPAHWRYERIHDRLEPGPDGEVHLTRTVRVRIDETVDPIDTIHVFMPRAFPTPDGVYDADGTPRPFDLDWKDRERELSIEVPELSSGDSIEVVVRARGRRTTTRDGEDLRIAYSPAPLAGPVDHLEVEVVVSTAASSVRPRPNDATEGTTEDGRALMRWSKDGLDHRSVERFEVVAGIDAPDEPLTWNPPKHYTRSGDLRLIAGLGVLALMILGGLAFRARRGTISAGAVVTAVLVTGSFFLLTPALYEDNFSYYAASASMFADGDLDRRDESYEFNRHMGRATKNRAGLDPMFGPLSRVPAFVAADVTVRVVNVFGFRYGRNGFSFPYYYLHAVADFFMVLLGCLACVALVKRRIGNAYAAPAVLAIFGGTHLGLMAYAWTASSFQPSMCLFAVFLDLWDRTRERRGALVWALGGLLMGFLFTTRTMNMSFGFVPFLDWAWVAALMVRRGEPRRLVSHVGMGVIFTTGFMVGYAPQLLLQLLVDHVWIIDNYGVGTGRFSSFARNVEEVFIDAAHGQPYRFSGLLTATPMIAFAGIGLLPLTRRDPRLGIVLTTTLAIQIWVITSYEVSTGYFTFGTPYFVPSSAIFCLGIAALLRTARETLPGVVGPILSAIVLVPAMLRGAWCMFRELADEQIGDWEAQQGTVDALYNMWLSGRKLNVDVLSLSSEFGVLAREAVGGLRSGHFGDVAMALFWFAFILGPVLLAGPMMRRARRAMSSMPATTRRRRLFVAGATALVLLYGFVCVVGWSTDLDYAHDRAKWEDSADRIEPRMLEDDDRIRWSFSAVNGCDRFSVVTFLLDAEDIPAGEQVGEVEIVGGSRRYSWPLLAGVDTADLYIERPEFRDGRRHGAPSDRVAWSWRVPDDSSRYYTARAYVSNFELPEPARRGSVRITSHVSGGRLAVALITAQEPKLGRHPHHQRWLAERW